MAAAASHQALHYAASSPVARAEIIDRLHETGAVTLFQAEAWGIEQSRALADEAYRTDHAGRLRHLVLVATAMTAEAQNALLKILEEPPSGVCFHCIFSPGMALLATVRSRLVTVVLPTEIADTAFYDAFTRLPLHEQLSEVEARVKEKDTAWIEGVRRGGLSRLAARVSELPADTSARLCSSLQRLGTRGAANKMLLEDIVLTIATAPKNR